MTIGQKVIPYFPANSQITTKKRILFMTDPVVIIGAGLAGLTCANKLHDAGLEPLLLEAADQVGGRVRTDTIDGFLLDRGFQVLLTAYPETTSTLDYKDLDLHTFDPGALIHTGTGFEHLADPWRQPQHLVSTLRANIGTWADKLRIARLRWLSSRGTIDHIFEQADGTTLDELHRLNFSDRMITQFLRPFLGGIFLENDLHTSRRMLYFVFRMFSQGNAALPAGGMGAITQQLARRLPEDSVRLHASVEAIGDGYVTLRTGNRISYSKIVLATEQSAAAKLVPQLTAKRPPHAVSCMYFCAPESPLEMPLLVLNGTGSGPVNNLCIPSQIAPSYAPEGMSLISATILHSTTKHVSQQHVIEHLQQWFGNRVAHWTHLKTYEIPYALPNQNAPTCHPSTASAQLSEKLYVCGDYRATSSINGAMASGRQVAEKILQS